MALAGTIRLFVGAGLVAAGGTLIAPLATRLLEAARTPPTAGQPAGAGVLAPGGAAVAPVGHAPSVAPPVLAAAVPGAESGVAVSAPLPDSLASGSADWLQLDRSPPPPPAPLPPPPTELARANPSLGAAYRSTLDVPPPPLLDTASPPPVTAWPVAASVAPPAAPSRGEVTVPATYRVRDGDDLGSIAGRFYGHPAAASAIWAANRETIVHPDLLPIGAEIRLPPPWSVRGHGRTESGAIEPAAHVLPVAGDPAVAPPASSAPSPWLVPVPVTAVSTTPAAPSAAAAPAPGRSVMTVVVGPGESLPALSRRLYGDPAMADQIFVVNRDRLRSPELVVTGMELRLPRPVTVPAP